MGRCLKLGIILENKLIVSKYVNNKKFAPKLMFFNVETIEKDSDDF